MQNIMKTPSNQIKSLSVLKNFSRGNTLTADNSPPLTERSRDSSKNTNMTHYTFKTNKTDKMVKVKKINYISKIPLDDARASVNQNHNKIPQPKKKKNGIKLSPYLIDKINNKVQKDQRDHYHLEVSEELPCDARIDSCLASTNINKLIVSLRATRANISNGVYSTIHRRGTDNYINNPLLGDNPHVKPGELITSELKTSIETKQSFVSERTINKAPINFGIDRTFLLKKGKEGVNIKMKLNKFLYIDKSFLNVIEFLSNEEINTLWKVSKRMRLMMYNTLYTNYKGLVDKFKLCLFKNKDKLFEYLKFGIIFSGLNRNKILIDFQLVCRVTTNIKNLNLKLHFITKSKDDLFCNTYPFDISNDAKPNSLWICREFTEFHLDPLQKCTAQPVLQFNKDDLFIFSINLLSIDKGFIDPIKSKFRIQLNQSDSGSNIPKSNKELTKNFNPRYCELEMFRTKWKDISTYSNANIVISKIRLIFAPFFEIVQILFDDVGYLIFKVLLKAITKGKIKDKKEIGIKIKVVNIDEVIKNEVKKNNLIYDKRNKIEVRIGDELIFYLSHNK